MSREDARRQVEDLITKYRAAVEADKALTDNETQIRTNFIDPFFAALGWAMTDNSVVKREATVQVKEDDDQYRTKKPDYAFYTGRELRFFLEAKKSSINLKQDSRPAFQVRRYGWSAKLPVCILTDFEELSLYNCRVQPRLDDKANIGRLEYYHFDDYLDNWDTIYDLLSYEAVLANSLESRADEKKQRGTITVDEAFLIEMERWRELLARDIYLYNPGLSVRQINTAVQTTIDRIVFWRICEDRGIELYGGLRDLLHVERKLYQDHLLPLFKRADAKYNSGLFHFQAEPGRDAPDTFTPTLTIGDDTLKAIIEKLYYPSPYVFAAIPADILGQIYERFLGKVIELGSDGATVVEKPEVRKAGGVYYTPTYIVDYIVRQTVGALVEGKDPAAVSQLRILDPACGSGSFLLGAYQFLLDWHLAYYTANKPEAYAKKGKGQRVTRAGEGWRLTTEEKKRILLNNLFGVDLDQQAVEVTKLSLLLKVLEGENPQEIALLGERVLPDLDDNIKWGNSLIGPDYYAGKQISLFEEEAIYRIKTFDWHSRKDGFGDILSAGGFDAVIGNPPYVFTRNKGIAEDTKTYYYDKYIHQGAQLNTFGLFIEQSLTLLRLGGTLGFIVPNNLLTISSFAKLREHLLAVSAQLAILNNKEKVFAEANVDTAVLCFSKGADDSVKVGELIRGVIGYQVDIPKTELKAPNYIFQIASQRNDLSISIIEKIESNSTPLGGDNGYAKVSTGLKVYQVGKGIPKQTKLEKENRVFHSHALSDPNSGRYLDGADVKRYRLGWSGEYLRYGDWIAEPRRSVPFVGNRILVRQIPANLPYLVHAVFTDQPYYHDINSMVIFAEKPPINIFYLLGIVNSRLLSHWFLETFEKLQRKTFPQFKVNELGRFPIRTIDFANPADVQRHDRMVALVTRMLDLHEQQGTASGPAAETIQSLIEATDREIDALVYDLYGLSADEIALVEASRLQA